MICSICKNEIDIDKIETEYISEWEVFNCENCNAMYLRVVKSNCDYTIDVYQWSRVA